MNNHYLLHIPHSGLAIPQEYMNDYLLSSDELQKNIYEYADLYTDELFEKLYTEFGGVKSEFSRLFFDPERFGDDEMESMQKEFGLGWFYENAILTEKALRTTKNKQSIRAYFDNHHEELNRLTAKKLKDYGRCTLLDCHSFSNERYWFHDNIQLPDICIGFEPNHIDTELVQIIKDEFKEYDIGINQPYKGSLVPTNYWGKDFRVKSVMIEINKKLYLEDDNTTKNSNFFKIKQRLDNICGILKMGFVK